MRKQFEKLFEKSIKSLLAALNVIGFCSSLYLLLGQIYLLLKVAVLKIVSEEFTKNQIYLLPKVKFSENIGFRIPRIFSDLLKIGSTFRNHPLFSEASETAKNLLKTRKSNFSSFSSSSSFSLRSKATDTYKSKIKAST